MDVKQHFNQQLQQSIVAFGLYSLTVEELSPRNFILLERYFICECVRVVGPSVFVLFYFVDSFVYFKQPSPSGFIYSFRKSSPCSSINPENRLLVALFIRRIVCLLLHSFRESSHCCFVHSENRLLVALFIQRTSSPCCFIHSKYRLIVVSFTQRIVSLLLHSFKESCP